MHQFKTLAILWELFVLFSIVSCGGDTCGPDAVDPPTEELSKWDRQRFPYFKYQALTFRIEEHGRIDTVTLQRTSVDSNIVKNGLGRDPHSGCYVGYESIYKTYRIQYGENGNRDKLIMHAETTGRGGALDIIWNENEIGYTFYGFDSFLGKQNDILDHDTVSILGKEYYPTACGEQRRSASETVYGCYNYPFGIVFIHDYQIEKKWYLLEAHSY